MDDHIDHHKENTDLCPCCLKSSAMNGCGKAHVRCRRNRRFDRDAGDGLVTLSASQSTGLHDKPEPGIHRGKGNVDDRETRGATIWKQSSKKLETVGDGWRDWLEIRVPCGIMLHPMSQEIDTIDDTFDLCYPQCLQ